MYDMNSDIEYDDDTGLFVNVIDYLNHNNIGMTLNEAN